MATRGTLFARALPSEIKIEETYSYVARVRSGAHVEPRVIHGNNPDAGGAAGQPGQGYVEVRVPYDGQHFFDEVALGDVRRAAGTWAGTDVDQPDAALEARVGHLVVQDFGRSNLAQNSRLSSWNSMDVTVPVLGRGVRSLDDLQSGRLEGRWRLEYAPEGPQPLPIQMEVSLTDEDELYPLQLALEAAERGGEQKKVAQLQQALADRLGRKAEFTSSLRLLFDVRLAFAAPFGVIDDPDPPELKLLWLEWPTMAAYRRLLLLAEDRTGQLKPHPVFFDPATKRLQWGGLRFFPPVETTEKGHYLYRAPRMELHVREARELVDVNTLLGNLVVEVPALLSGLSLHYFDALGALREAREVPAKVKSTLDVELSLDLVECFERRSYSPFQYLQLPGFVPDQMYLWDIIGLLESMQFTMVGEPAEVPVEDGSQTPVRRDYLVTATRAEGASSVWLWLRLGGQSLQTERQREGENGDSHKTLRGGGDLTIAIRSELDGNSQRSVEVLSQLHERFKQRFHFERVVN